MLHQLVATIVLIDTGSPDTALMKKKTELETLCQLDPEGLLSIDMTITRNNALCLIREYFACGNHP